MARYVALLRAVNVAGRFVRMPQLLQACDAIGASRARTVIASGNLVFDARARTEPALVARLQAALRDTLGFDVTAFLRPAEEVRAQAAAAPPFDAEEIATAEAVHVLFLHQAPDGKAMAALAAMQRADTRLAARGREVFWLAQHAQSTSTFSAALLERRLRTRTTLRTWATLQRIAATLDD